MRCFFMTVPLQHFLAFFLPNDAARVRDIRVSYVASLISAYAKLSNPPPPPPPPTSLSLSLSMPEIYALWPTHLTSTFCDSLK